MLVQIFPVNARLAPSTLRQLAALGASGDGGVPQGGCLCSPGSPGSQLFSLEDLISSHCSDSPASAPTLVSLQSPVLLPADPRLCMSTGDPHLRRSALPRELSLCSAEWAPPGYACSLSEWPLHPPLCLPKHAPSFLWLLFR